MFATPQRRKLEKELALQAEVAYRRLVVHRQPGNKAGAWATRGAHLVTTGTPGETGRQVL
jgi:hypothetical protein